MNFRGETHREEVTFSFYQSACSQHDLITDEPWSPAKYWRDLVWEVTLVCHIASKGHLDQVNGIM